MPLCFLVFKSVHQLFAFSRLKEGGKISWHSEAFQSGKWSAHFLATENTDRCAEGFVEPLNAYWSQEVVLLVFLGSKYI